MEYDRFHRSCSIDSDEKEIYTYIHMYIYIYKCIYVCIYMFFFCISKLLTWNFDHYCLFTFIYVYLKSVVLAKRTGIFIKYFVVLICTIYALKRKNIY